LNFLVAANYSVDSADYGEFLRNSLKVMKTLYTLSELQQANRLSGELPIEIISSVSIEKININLKLSVHSNNQWNCNSSKQRSSL
jgi:hypothetical protein